MLVSQEDKRNVRESGSESVVSQTWKTSADGVAIIRSTVVAGLGSDQAIKPLDSPDPNDDEFKLRSRAEQAYLRGAAFKEVDTPGGSEAPKNGLKILDLYSGVGGLSYGIKSGLGSVGIENISTVGVDLNHRSLSVFQRNFPNSKVRAININRAVDYAYVAMGGGVEFDGGPEIIDSDLKEMARDVDVVVGGPPCQGHSNFNNHSRRDDPRNELYITPAAIGVAVGARAIVIENVHEVVRANQQVVEITRKLLVNEGYCVSEGVIRGVEVGIPQTRKRHFLIATKGRHENIDSVSFQFRTPVRSVRWAIGDLLGQEGLSWFDKSAELSEENQRRIQYLIENEEYDLPNSQRPVCHQNGTSYTSVYGRLDWELPSGTITTGFFTPGRGRYVHPEEARTLTAHEAARLQTFPDHFDFMPYDDVPPSRSELSQWIGDAVPPVMGHIVGLVLLSSFSH